MSEPVETYFLDDGFEPSNSGTSLVDISDETPEETALRILAEESWQRYQFLRRRATRRTPRSHFFELQPHGRGFRPAAMGSTNRPTVPLPMGDSAPTGDSEDVSTLNPVQDGAVGGTAPEVPHTNPMADAAAQGTDGTSGVAAGTGQSDNRSNRSSPNFFNDQNRTQQVLRVIDEGPRGGNQSVNSDQGNRSIRESLQRAVAQTGQAVGDAFRHCANASPFRQPGAPTHPSPQDARSQGALAANSGPAIQLDLAGHGGPRASVHLSRAQIDIHHAAGTRTRNDSRGAFPRTLTSQQQAAIAQNTHTQTGATSNNEGVELPVNDQSDQGGVVPVQRRLMKRTRQSAGALLLLYLVGATPFFPA